MFGIPPKMIPLPDTMQRPMEIGYACILSSFGVMFTGMILASIWQWAFDIKATSLWDSPLLLQAMMVTGFVALLVSAFGTHFGIPIWNKIKYNNMPWF
jgi:hypothetical protein